MSTSIPLKRSIEEELADAALEYCQQRGYKLVSVLGQGASKRVYRVSAADSDLAVKLVVISGDPSRLLREVAALNESRHPNIARLIGAELWQYQAMHLLVVVEEFVSGGTLEERLRSGPMSPRDALIVGKQLTDVLALLKERRLVHRDIKPANILFNSDGTPVLTDFGIVRALDMPALTKDYLAMGPGTPKYAAPEQLNNQKDLIDWRTDQFGLAVVLSESVLARHPFQEPNGNIHAAIGDVAARKEIPKTTAIALEKLGLSMLIKALAPWPAMRYRTPQDLMEALS